MMGEQQNEVRAVFIEALALTTADERARYLDVACRDKPGLRQRVEALLSAREQASEFLAQDALGGNLDCDPAITEGPGTVIGRYKLLEQIGEGGFGVVFMAEQLEPIRRRVALKIVKPGMDTKQVIARFEAERQALALMDHPNIAKIFDAGVIGAPSPQLSTLNSQLHFGRPYFVMELVHGVPLTEFCDANDSTPQERLQLFIQVCHAVQHAHQKGIIHRDLKPSNILVTLHDGKPVPKVIDFGTAKALQHSLTEKTLFTAYGKLIGTPQYMSPEQAELSGLDVDTRADIYALGVLLYELLTGTTPFEAEQLRTAAFEEMLRIIRQEEPPKPSTRVSTLGARATEIARHRQVDPAMLRRALQGDLDWIVMKALEKDRARRYETASALVEDLQHHLNHEPVRASPPGRVYRARKFVRRHRMGVALAASITVALIAGLVVSLIGFAQAKRERDRAVAAEQQAEEEKIVARMVSDFLQNDLLDVEGEPDRELKLRTVVNRADEQIGNRFAGQPLAEASVRLTFGTIHCSVRELEAAELHFMRALELRTKILGSNSFPVLEVRRALGNLRIEQGRLGEGETLLREVLEAAERALGPTNAFSLSARHSFAEALSWRDLDKATTQFEIALAGQRQTLPAGHEEILSTLYDFADVRVLQGRFTEAEALSEEACRASAVRWGADSVQFLRHRAQLAQAYARISRIGEACDIFEGAIPVFERRLGPDHWLTLRTKGRLGGALLQLGEFERAEQLQREVVDRCRLVLGPTHRRTTDALGALAECQWSAGRQQDSIATVAEVMSLLESKLDSFEAMGRDWLDYEAKQAGRFGYWKPCAAFHLRLLTRDATNDPANWARGAVATLMNRDFRAYGDVCQGMIRQWNTATDPSITEPLARVLLLVPSADTQLEAACLRADSLPVGEGFPSSHPLLRGVADYRRGRWAEAERWMRQVQSTDLYENCLRDYFEAMARHQNGDKAGALANLQSANRSLETILKPGDLGWIWESDGRCVLARIEAERLILGHETSPFPDAVWLLEQRCGKNRP